MWDIFWESNKEWEGEHLVRWRGVCQAKENGGLGIGNIINYNKALISKWLWRFLLEYHSLWNRVIWSKYGLSLNGITDSKNASVFSFRNSQILDIGRRFSYELRFMKNLRDREMEQISNLTSILESFNGYEINGCGS
ncbi:hypothetical protein PanWU01x14_208170 [Parasponia andersonii]|uniref:Uncharacterized protein n=1 Tax=Parasponia andersonii TaxID=3476 RepID=A0A2P5BUU6_PARAD|nr:hypothetical protein PanWU01x14_208170 [Parasponia andersonii]